MKLLLATVAITFSLNVSAAADMDKYCVPFLNGGLEGQGGEKPEIMEGFKAEKTKLIVGESVVPSISIEPEEAEKMGDKKTISQPWGEEVHMNILKFKKNGKPVKDFTMIIKRDKAGNLLSITKKPVLFQDFKLKSDTLTFRPQNDTCIPEKYVEGKKLKFSSDLCRELDRFFAENPTAKACLIAKHDQKLASLIKEHALSLGEKIVTGIEKKSEDISALYGAKHRVDCSEFGLDVLLNDKGVWETHVGRRGEDKVGNKASQE